MGKLVFSNLLWVSDLLFFFLVSAGFFGSSSHRSGEDRVVLIR